MNTEIPESDVPEEAPAHKRGYLHGVGGEGQDRVIPGHVLCFSRRDREGLGVRQGKRLPIRSHHGRHVFIAALRGSGRVCVDEHLYLLKPGEALLIPPYAFHTYTDLDESICWVFITFDAPAAAYEAISRGGARVLGELERRLLHEALLCWKEVERHGLLPLHLGLLLARLPVHTEPRKRRPGQALPSLEGELLRAINRHVLPRLSEPLSVSQVAEALGLSESHLRARFREVAGVSLGRHLRKLRLQRACLLLHTTSHSIGEISAQCGFSSLYAFSRTFRESLACSPSDYRKWGMALKNNILTPPPGSPEGQG